MIYVLPFFTMVWSWCVLPLPSMITSPEPEKSYYDHSDEEAALKIEGRYIPCIYFHKILWRKKNSKHNVPCAYSLQRSGVSNHRRLDCLLSRLFRADQRKHQSSAPLGFVRGIQRWPVDYPHKGPVTRKKVPFDDVSCSWDIQNALTVHCPMRVVVKARPAMVAVELPQPSMIVPHIIIQVCPVK